MPTTKGDGQGKEKAYCTNEALKAIIDRLPHGSRYQPAEKADTSAMGM